MSLHGNPTRGVAEAAPPSGVTGRRGSPSDLILGCLYLLVAGGMIYLSVESSIVTPPWPMLPLTAAGIGALAVRRQWPRVSLAVALTLTMASFAVGTGAEFLLVVPLLYREGIVRSARAAWIWLAATGAVSAVAALILVRRTHEGPPLLGLSLRTWTPDWPVEWVNFFVPMAAVAAVATLLGINVGHRRRHLASLVERADQLRRERDQQASIATARERERIAREMHDVIAHSLAVMVALADGAEASAERRPEQSREAIARVAETGRQTLTEVRRLLGRVRGDEPLDGPRDLAQPDADQVPSLVEGFREAGLPVRLEITGALERGSAVGLTAYRIVQESLTNVLRHATGVRDVLVRLDLSDDDVVVLVEDTSEPARASGDPGRGLLGIRERAALYDGTVDSGPRAEGGWRVRVHLPVRSDDT